MALKNRKITEESIGLHGVISAPDKLTGTAAENKRVFDNLVRAVVAESVNGLIDELTSSAGAGEIGVEEIEGVGGGSVQDVLVTMKALLSRKLEDLTPEQIEVLKGPKGDPFTFDDFTEEQLAALKGEPGDTPVRGEDYWTEEDKAEIVDDTVAALEKAGFSGGMGAIESTEYPGCYYREVDGVVEWVNPPTIAGVEYCTTERYLGEPVYVQAVEYGKLPASASRYIIIGKDGNVSYLPIVVESLVAYDSSSDYYIEVLNNSDFGISAATLSRIQSESYPKGALRLQIVTTVDRSAYTATAVIKYTKTTD